jgi:hypothetical protein
MIRIPWLRDNERFEVVLFMWGGSIKGEGVHKKDLLRITETK